jgi:uncharacterized DUF497 family protein
VGSEEGRRDLQKHGVDFADVVEVLYDDLAITIADEISSEERYVTLGPVL